jgi:hypothetical protein
MADEEGGKLTVIEQVKEAAYRTRLKWRGGSDAEKACRAIEGYELGLVPLMRLYSRKTALKILDPGEGKQMFGASERHIRRVETIRQKRPHDAARLERAAMLGALSMELVEWIVNHSPTEDTLEAIWLTANDKARKAFMARMMLRYEA